MSIVFILSKCVSGERILANGRPLSFEGGVVGVMPIYRILEDLIAKHGEDAPYISAEMSLDEGTQGDGKI